MICFCISQSWILNICCIVLSYTDGGSTASTGTGTGTGIQYKKKEEELRVQYEKAVWKSKIFIITSKFKMFHNQQFVINTMFFSEYCSAKRARYVSVSALCMNHFLEQRNKEKRKITEYKFEWQWKYNAASERSSSKGDSEIRDHLIYIWV